ncbi:MAG: hypothetical protein IJK77_01600 [Lachnospiraceae bacterium]|nr:hypothetical protein [Lachnospiraceae bacterium]
MNENETPNVNVDPVTPDPVPQDAPYVQPAIEPASKKGFPKLILIAVLAVAVVAAGFFGVKALLGGTPLARAMTGVKKSFEALEKNEYAATMKNVSEAGSMNISVDLSKLSDMIGTEVPAKVELTTYASLKNYKAALEIDAQLKNKSILHGTLTASDEELAVACEQILGKKNYSLSFKDLAKNLPKSVFDPDSDTDYALPEEIYNWLVGLKNGPIAPMKEIVKDAKPVLEEAAKVLKESTEKNGEISKGSETISIGEADVKTNTVTVKLNGKQAAAIATDLLKWAKSDKDLKDLLTKVTTTYGPVLDEEFDVDDFLDDFYDGIDEALEEMEDVEKDDVNLTAVFYTNKSNGQLVKAEITTKDEYGKTVYTLEGGPDWKDLAYYSLSVNEPYGKSSVTYNVEENTKSQFTAKIKVKEDGNTTMSATYSWDKSTGDLRISSNEADFKLTGTMTQKGKVTTIELKKFEYGRYITIKDLGTTITLNESAKLPSISKTTEVVKLSEDDIEALFEDVKDAVQELMEKVQDEMD